MIYDFQKASLVKRFSAFLLDFVLIVVLATFFAFLVSLISNYSAISNEFQNYYLQYEELYGITLTDQKAYEAFSEAELALYNEAMEAMNSDTEVLRCWGLVSTLPVVMVSVGILFGTLIVEFLMPLILKNGQTVGKKIFKIGVIRVDGVKATHFQLFTRSLLGKCAIEYLIPGIIISMMMFGTIGIVGPLIILVLVIAQLVVFFKDPERYWIHDLIAGTGVCDLSTQMVFETTDDLIKYKEQISKDAAESAAY